jgi:two-component system, OmpR family, KDP operon response regulator KdpE
VGRQRVLFVDDDSQIRRMMRTILTAQGYEIIDTWGAAAAMEKLRSEKFDLVLLDINMPGIDGIEACRMMRSVSDLPIVMVTVRKGEKDRIDAFEAGADDYVVKPFNTPTLLALIRATLKKRA